VLRSPVDVIEQMAAMNQHRPSRDRLIATSFLIFAVLMVGLALAGALRMTPSTSPVAQVVNK
jgi:hypothetical protein